MVQLGVAELHKVLVTVVVVISVTTVSAVVKVVTVVTAVKVVTLLTVFTVVTVMTVLALVTLVTIVILITLRRWLLHLVGDSKMYWVNEQVGQEEEDVNTAETGQQVVEDV